MAPLLLRLRSGRIAASVLAFGFGGGTMILGGVSLGAGAMHGAPIAPGLLGYAVAATPFFALAIIVALCRSELWFDPEARAFRLLTFRPWLRNPRIEQAALDEYAGVRIEPPNDDGGPVVSLVSTTGELVPLRQFSKPAEASVFADELATATGLWLRGPEAEPPAGAPADPA